jgi:peptidoglycan-N-acetylglucosamine deacetylase
MSILMLATGVIVGCAAYLSPQVKRFTGSNSLRSICSASRSLVLSFDDGPGSTLTSEVLDLLKSHGARANFFLLGSRAARLSSIVDRIAQERHEIGCHTAEHRDAWRSTPWTTVRDIRAGYAALQRWIPAAAAFRPPHGRLLLPGWLALKCRGAPIAWWTVDSGDTHPTLPNTQAILERVLRHGGGVVLLHDFERQSSERHRYVLQMTDQLLRCAAKEDLRVQVLSELGCAQCSGN